MVRPMARRSYDQYCGLARALDVLGERWTLLLVRELVMGPRRFRDLQEGLPGIGPNVLSARLKMLEAEGIAARRRLPPPGALTVYELTERGRGIEDAIVALTRWGRDRLGEPCVTDRYQPGWLLMGLRVVFKPWAAKGQHLTYQLRINGEPFSIHVDDGDIAVEQTATADPDVIFALDSKTLMAISSGRLSATEAFANGRVKVVAGDPVNVLGFMDLFELPSRKAADPVRGPASEPRTAVGRS